MTFSIIAAIDQKRGIGKNNQIPWHLSGDFKFFAETTKATTDPQKQNAVIMGSKTWESLPEAFKPLPGRLNVVLNRESGYDAGEGVPVYESLEQALANLKERSDIEQAFIIGGGQLYAYAINLPECTKLYLTEIQETFDCDTFFPEIPEHFKESTRSETHEEKGITYQFVTYTA